MKPNRWRGRRATVFPSAPLRRRPENVLRERYASGEIGWEAYREALVNLLKDRYVRGELGLAEYEEHLAHLFWRDTPRVTGTEPDATRSRGDQPTMSD